MKKIYTILTLSIAIFVASCGSEDKKPVVDNSPAIRVKTSQVTANGSSPFLSVSGKIQATNSADLSTRMMGYVNKVHVNVGDKVRKGQLLVSINNSDLQAKRVEAANQMKNEINAQFAYSNITAPFSGTVTSKNVEAGNMANPGVSLISIETPGNFEVMAMVPETEISAIKKGTLVDVLVKSINKTLKGKVAEVSTSAKNTGGQYLVKIDVDKTDANILSGMFTTVQFPVERKATSSMVLIPVDAIVSNGQLSGVYTVSQSNTALLRWLRLGRTFGDQVEVLSGLHADESYIVSAEGKLFNGAKITILLKRPKYKNFHFRGNKKSKNYERRNRR